MFVPETTQEEYCQILDIDKEIRELTREARKVISNIPYKDGDSQFNKNQEEKTSNAWKEYSKKYTELTEAQRKIYMKAEERFLKAIDGDKDYLSKKIKQYIKLISKERFKESYSYILQSKKEEENAQEFYSEKFLSFIEEECFYLLYAWNYFDFPAKEIEAIIQEKLDSLYPGVHYIYSGLYCEKRNIPASRDKLSVTKADYFEIANSKIANKIETLQDALFNMNPDGQLSLMETLAPGVAVDSKGEVTSIVGIQYVGGELSYNQARIKAFDKAVLDTVCSLINAGNMAFTVSDIWKTMKGNTQKKPSKEQKLRIESSLLKLSGTRVYLNITEELQKAHYTFNDERLTKGEINENMLSFRMIKAKTQNGQEVDAIQLLSVPIIYAYSKAKGQIVSFKTELLNLPINEDEKKTAFKFYLLRRISSMKGGALNNKNIKYSTIYEEAGVTVPEIRRDKLRDRESIKTMLDYWKQEGFIKDYSEYKEGKSIEGVTIDF